MQQDVVPCFISPWMMVVLVPWGLLCSLHVRRLLTSAQHDACPSRAPVPQEGISMIGIITLGGSIESLGLGPVTTCAN
jgi:hypothetical protein